MESINTATSSAKAKPDEKQKKGAIINEDFEELEGQMNGGEGVDIIEEDIEDDNGERLRKLSL